jgi:hypothetical protein
MGIFIAIKALIPQIMAFLSFISAIYAFFRGVQIISIIKYLIKNR